MNGPRVDEVQIDLLDLSLRTTFRTHWKTLRRHATLRIRLRSEGIWGEGEAYTMDPDGGLAVLRSLDLEGRGVGALLGRVPSIPGNAPRSAVDMALHDLAAKAAGLPLYRMLELPAVERTTCVSVGLDEEPVMLEAARAWIALGHPIVKIKITGTTDLHLLEEIREVGGPGLRIWVDANQGFDPPRLIDAAETLRRVGIEIVEQPFPIGRMGEYAAVGPRLGIPIVLDEEIRSAEDVLAAVTAGGIDGVNLKLAKLGGIRETLRAARLARRHGLSILLGCFFESSLGISGATHLLALADRVDLDAPLFLEEDPYRGLTFKVAAIAPPGGPGLGVEARRP